MVSGVAAAGEGWELISERWGGGGEVSGVAAAGEGWELISEG